MAGLSSEPVRTGRRAVDHALALVPFIDFLLCLVAFLLVTAVWSHRARLQADARVPGTPGTTPPLPATELHVSVTDQDFLLKWQQGGTVLASTHLAKGAVTLPDGSLRYPELSRAAGEQWRKLGSHRGGRDTTQDRAILHTPNSLEFREVTAVLDALHGPKRKLDGARGTGEIPAFAVAFATD